jgi:hypothetical protein
MPASRRHGNVYPDVEQALERAEEVYKSMPRDCTF